MTRRKTRLSTNPNFKGFVNVPLDDKVKAAIKARSFNPEDFDTWLDRMVAAGYKLTFAIDSYNDAYQCAVTHTDEDHENFGYFLVGRGSTPLKAFKQALYVHDTILDGHWSLFTKPMGKEEIDD